jgi:hypothetical protein
MQISVIELPTPELEFGDDKQYFSDPRVGLAAAGPFSLRFGRAHISRLRIGLVGVEEQLKDARAWYRRCQGPISTGKPSQPMYLDYPGFENAFQTKLEVQGAPEIDITQKLRVALARPKSYVFDSVLTVYEEGIRRLAESSAVDVVICCLPPEVLATCWSTKRYLTAIEKKELRAAKKADQSQLTFDALWTVDDTPESLLQRDFRRALKAKAMQIGTPIQIATGNLLLDNKASQDPATRAWNSTVALFFKGGGIPWRVRTEGPETCFVGISFHYLRTNKSDLMYSSLAQAFSSEGEGFALKGDTVPRSTDRRKVPQLTREQAVALGERITSEYRERTGKDPARVVLHKTTQFNEVERSGFEAALKQIPVLEFVNIAPSDFRLVQRAAYPPKRGTLCRINNESSYLFTTGYIPEWKTYPGMHIPVPVQIRTDRATDLIRTANEVLSLARMNWNTAFDTTGAPITLRFARQVGGIMAEAGQAKPNPSYRFYM